LDISRLEAFVYAAAHAGVGALS